MEKMIGCVKDALKVMTAATMVTMVVVVITAVLEIVIHGINLSKALEWIRAGLFITGSLGLLLSALFIIKNKTDDKMKYERQWKSKFHEFNFTTVLFIFSITILFYGTLFDIVLFKITMLQV